MFKNAKYAILALMASALPLVSSPAKAGDCKVYWTEYQGQADYTVYLTEYSGQEKRAALISGCTVTKYFGQATYKLYLTEYQGQADIVISYAKVPKP